MIAVPDPASYTLVPWQPGLAVLQCDIAVEGEPWPYARLILKGMLAKARERGYVYNVGCEAEVLPGPAARRGRHRAGRPARPGRGALLRRQGPDPDVRPSVHRVAVHEPARLAELRQRSRGRERPVRAELRVLRRAHVGRPAGLFPLHGAHARAPGGHGRHLHTRSRSGTSPAPACTCIRACGTSSRGGAVRRPGRPARARAVGARVPLHRGAGRARPGDGGGHLPDGQLLPKRFGVGAPQSGATWAPAYATYGGNNRTQMLRVPEGGRVENRGCDGSANPYLAMAVQLAAGLDGIDRGLDPGEPNRDNLHVLSAEEVASRGSGRCRRPCCTRPTNWLPTTCCARRWARRRTGTT